LLQFKVQNVWSLVDCPKGVRPIGTKLVLKNKKDERGIVIRNKARLVAQGHTQEEGIDYDEVFVPVARIKAIRLFLAYASFMGFTVYQMDVKSPFLYGTIDEEVGIIDQTLFIKRQRGDFILVQVYVDDIIFGSSNPQLCREIENLMHEKFKMSAMGELNFFLGLQVLQKEDGIFLSQDKIKTTEEGTKILATVGGKLRTVSESSIRRNLKLNGEAGIRQFSHQWKYLIHTIMQCLSPKSIGFNEFNRNIATALVFLATNRVYIFSKMIFDGMFGQIPHTQTYVVPFHTRKIFTTLRVNSPSFSGRIVPLFASMLDPQGEGSGTPTESHHTPTSEASQSSQHELPSPSLPPVPTKLLPIVIPSDNPPLRQYTRRTRIAQSLVLPPVVDEPASPLGDDSQGKACPTDSGFEADQDRANIAKTSTLPSDSTLRVTSLAADEGSMQHKLDELMALCTSLQRQQSEMDKDRWFAEQSEDDAPIKGRRLDEREEVAERVSDDTEEMATVLTSMDATSILTSGGVQVVPTSVEVATATVSIPTCSGVVSTASPSIPIATLIFTTTTETTPYTRRKGKEKMVESNTPKKKKIAWDAEIARIHVEKELQMLIDGLDRNNETVAKYLQEYDQFAAELPFERRIELISDLEEAERFKRKGLRLEYESVKKLETPEEVKETKEVLKDKVKEMMQLVPVEEHLDREDLNKLWRLVKEFLSIRPASNDKEMELWVDNYSHMANDLILKIYKIANCPSQQDD
nr:hypothetical protein [Tanacetum cinerariifolium]